MSRTLGCAFQIYSLQWLTGLADNCWWARCCWEFPKAFQGPCVVDRTSFITWKILQCHSLKFTRCHALWTWLALGLTMVTLLWMDGMLYLTAFGHELDCQTIMVIRAGWKNRIFFLKLILDKKCRNCGHIHRFAFISILLYLHTCILAYTCILSYLHICIIEYLHNCILAYMCICAYVHTWS